MNAISIPFTYPAQYYRAARSARVGAAVHLILSLLIVGVSVIGGIQWDWAPLVVSVAIALVLFFAVSPLRSLREPLAVAVVPFFPYPDGAAGSDSGSCVRNLGGHALARHAGTLDDLARREGVAPLSTFGYTEDALPPGAGAWQDATTVLPVLAALATVLRADPAMLGPVESEAVLADLQTIATRLQQAAENGVPFRFYLRYGDACSHTDTALRHGTYLPAPLGGAVVGTVAGAETGRGLRPDTASVIARVG